MKTKNPIALFLIEVINRYKTRSPKLFKLIQNLSIICGLVTGLPEAIEWMSTIFGYTTPEFILSLANKTVTIGSGIALLISGLTVDEDHVETKALKEAVLEDKSIKEVKQELLPFSKKPE